MRNFFTEILSGGPPPAAAEREQDDEAPAAPATPKWGLKPEHVTGAYDARDIFEGDRASDLQFRGDFYFARLHDRKAFDMNGVPIGGASSTKPGFPGAQGFLAQTGSPQFVPISQRRPNAPYRLSRTIVKAFTGMIFGVNRWPQIRSDDPKTQAFCEAIVKATNLRNRMVRGRNIAGACGTAGFDWQFRAGRPVVHVRSGRFCRTLEWEDQDEFLPRHVTMLYQTFAVRDTKDGPQRFQVWRRLDWTTEADVVFKPVEVTPGNPEAWVVDEERSYEHGDGECHFVWMPNFPDDEDPTAEDGQPDYAELYESLETLDGSNSTLVQGVNKNLDPTLVVKRENPEQVKAIRKGSENAIVVDPTGGAEYLTLGGDVANTGEKVVTLLRRQILEVAQCIVADPNEVAGAGTSSLTMKLVYAPMIGASDLLREPGGTALVRLLEQMQRSAKRVMAPAGDELQPVPKHESIPEETSPEDSQFFDESELEAGDQEPVVVQYFLQLPPRVISEDVLDADGKPTGETRESKVEQEPGDGKIELEWGEYFPPTSDDKQKTMTTMSTSTGGRAVISQQTAVEVTAALLNKDSTQEWQRLRDEEADRRFDPGDAGGSVDAPDAPPTGDVPEQATTDADSAVDPENVQETVFNGAQVASLVEIITSVVAKKLPRDAALGIIQLAFNVSLETAALVMGSAGDDASTTEASPVAPLPEA